MFLVVNKNNDPAWNLALEEHLFNLSGQSGRNFVMFWKNRPSVIVGRFQNTVEEINEKAVKAAGVKVVRRPTGGGAVYHDLNNLNYSLIVAHNKIEEFDFRALAQPVLTVLRRLGVPAELSGRNDLTVGGKKFSGTAQQAGATSVLYHGTLLYDTNLERLSEMLRVDPAKYRSKGAKSVRSRVTNLKQWLPPGFRLNDLEEELVREISADEFKLTAEDLEAVNSINLSKYDTWEWNWSRSPEFSVRKEKRFPWGNISLHLDVVEGLIRQSSIFGDFFAGDLSAILNRLCGLPYGSPEAASVIADLAGNISGATTEDLAQL